MKHKPYLIASVLGLSLAIQSRAFAEPEDALIDALVQKGVISSREAAQIRDKSMEDIATPSANIIHFGDAIKNLTIYGDVRLRAEIREGSYGKGEVNANTGTLYTSGGSQGEDRLRYRVVMGLNGDLYDNFFFGLGVSTSPTSNRGTSVTFGGNDTAGPFGKARGILAINRVFLGWRPTDYLTLEAGQIDNPLYSTPLTWDVNIHPTGFAELFQKDACNFTVFGNFGQFLYSAPSFTNTSVTPGLNYSNTFLLAEQVGLKYKFNDDINAKIAVGLDTYTGTRNSTANNNGQTQTSSFATAPLVETGAGNYPNDFSGPFTGGAADPISNNYGVNNLAVLDVPAEFNFKIYKVPMQIFGDFAVNLNAQERSDAAAQAVANGTAVTPVAGGSSAATLLGSEYFKNLKLNNSGQDIAYEAGIQAGKLKDSHDWQVKAYWIDRQYYSVDPNLIDLDEFNAALNMQGPVFQASYNLSKGVTATVTYGQASRSDKRLATPGIGQDLSINPIDQYKIVQADIGWKF
jgi:hypothetical protein